MSPTVQSLEVIYQLTADDYRHGFLTWRMRTPWKRPSYGLSIGVLACLFAMGAVLLFWGPSLELRYFSLFALGIPIVGFLSLWGAPYIHGRLQYRRMPSAQTPITMTVSDSVMNTQSKHGKAEINWSTFIGWAESEAVFVLFPQPRIYIPNSQASLLGRTAS